MVPGSGKVENKIDSFENLLPIQFYMLYKNLGLKIESGANFIEFFPTTFMFGSS